MILTTVFIQIQNQNKFIENLKLFKKRNPKTLKPHVCENKCKFKFYPNDNLKYLQSNFLFKISG